MYDGSDIFEVRVVKGLSTGDPPHYGARFSAGFPLTIPPAPAGFVAYLGEGPEVRCNSGPRVPVEQGESLGEGSPATIGGSEGGEDQMTYRARDCSAGTGPTEALPLTGRDIWRAAPDLADLRSTGRCRERSRVGILGPGRLRPRSLASPDCGLGNSDE
jgi:hypothetical protein